MNQTSSGDVLYEIGIDVPQWAEDTAAVLLQHLGGSDPAFIMPVPDDGLPMPDDVPDIPLVPEGRTRVTSYFSLRPDDAVLETFRADVGRRLREDFGVMQSFVEPMLVVRELKVEDYSGAWKRFFKPLRAGKRFLVLPPWRGDDPDEGRIVIVINPAAAFGTGQHETTRLCLRAIEEVVDAHHPASMADIGCGSGILAIGAAKLGVASAVGVDIDPVAAEESMRNAERNGIPHLRFFAGGPGDVPGVYPLVVANILLAPLLALADDIIARVEPRGLLVLSGIIAEQAADLAARYTALGMTEVSRLEEHDWRALIMQRNP